VANVKRFRGYPKVVFFDLDGTLVEFRIDYLAARREALRLLENRGYLRELKFTLKDSIFFMDREIKRLLNSRGELTSTYEQIHSELMAIVERYESQAANRTKLLPFAKETLEELRRMGLRLVLFTADGDRAMNAIVEKTAIRQLFDALVSRGSSVEVKPHPQHITSAISSVNSKPEETIIVGDSVVDIASGKHINAITVGVTTGLSSKQQLAEAGADHLIDSITKLPSLIRRLWSEQNCRSTTR